MSRTAGDDEAPRGGVARTDVWPMRVCLTRRRVGSGPWETDSWSLTRIDSDRDDPPARIGCERLAAEPGAQGDGETFCWRGLALELFRDERDAYRFNLASGNPRLFVNCNADDTGVMAPQLLTASQDVAASYMDGGEEDVFSIAMPLAVQCWIEAFIAHHGEPEMMLGKSRRRRHGGGRDDRTPRG